MTKSRHLVRRPQSTAVKPSSRSVDVAYSRGISRIRELDGEAGVEWCSQLRRIAPDFERYLVATAYGDIWSRTGLSARDREIATIGALTAMATVKAELVSHIAMGLKIGLSQNEILEIIMHVSIYAGMPASLEGIDAARSVFGNTRPSV